MTDTRANVRFSIIIPVYNAEAYLSECVNSIQNQSYQNIEILLIDDGSEDSSLKIAQKLSQFDKRIKVAHKSNAGVSSARNLGIKKAVGEYIIFIDADDYLIDVKAVEKIDYSIKKGSDTAIYNIRYENKRLKHTLQAGQYIKRDNTFNKFLFTLIKNEYLNSVCNKAYKSKIINQNRIRFDERLKVGEDLLFNIEYFKHSQSVHYLCEDIYLYRTSNVNSATSRYMNNKYSELIYVNDKMKDWVKNNNQLSALSDYIRLKNTLSSIRDLFLPTFPYDSKYRNERINAMKKNSPKIIVKKCGPKIFMISVIYSLLNVRGLELMFTLVYGVRK